MIMVNIVKLLKIPQSSYLSVLEHLCSGASPRINFKKNAVLFTAILYLHRRWYCSFCIIQSWQEIVILARSQRHFHGPYLVLQGWMDRLFICWLLLLLALLQVNQNLQVWCRNCQGLCNADESITPCGLELCEFNTSAVSDCIYGCTASAVPGDMDHPFFQLGFVLQWQWEQILQSTVKHAKCIIQLSFNASWHLLAKQDEMVFLETSATNHSLKKKKNPNPCSSFSQGLCSSVWWEKNHIPLLN